MELENTHTDASPEISDSQRLAAVSKKLELSPLHSDIAPEALPDGTAADTFGSAAIAPSVEIDTENTADFDTKAVVMPPKTSPALKTTYVALVVVVTVITIAAITFLVTRH